MKSVPFAAFLVFLCATGAGAQRGPALPFDHWSRAALYRLAGTAGADAGAVLHTWPLTRTRARQLLGTDSALSAAAWRFLDEEGSADPLHIEVESGFAGHADRLRAGTANRAAAIYGGPIPLENAADFATRLRADLALGNRFALSIEVRDTAELRLAEATASALIGPVLIRAGRMPLSFGRTGGNTFVLHELPPQTGALLELPDGFVLPGALDILGRIRFTQFIGRMHRSGDIMHPWLTATRFTFAFSPAFVFGVQRAMILGGEGNEGITARRVFLALIGLTDTEGKTTDFENQVVGVDAFLRLPGNVSLHGEWGADDSGEAFLRVPAFRLGIDWHVLPFAPALGAGLDAVLITPAFDTYPPWYQHLGLGDGWTNEGRLLGHPLGGHGRELSLALTASSRAVQGMTRLTFRHRGEQNLFAPHLEGNALLLNADGAVRLGRDVRLRVRGEVERHRTAGWSSTTWIGLSVRLN